MQLWGFQGFSRSLPTHLISFVKYHSLKHGEAALCKRGYVVAPIHDVA